MQYSLRDPFFPKQAFSQLIRLCPIRMHKHCMPCRNLMQHSLNILPTLMHLITNFPYLTGSVFCRILQEPVSKGARRDMPSEQHPIIFIICKLAVVPASKRGLHHPVRNEPQRGSMLMQQPLSLFICQRQLPSLTTQKTPNRILHRPRYVSFLFL